MKLGVMMPLIDVGGQPDTARQFAQAAERLGYDHLALADHVLGVDAANRPEYANRNNSKDMFHDPFVLFGFLAGCTTKIGFSTQVLILPQRQTALVAKQVACLDVLSQGRFRLGIGVGWNPVEFVGLNEDFSNRGRRSEEQVQLLKALWAEPHVRFQGKWHKVEDAGINPLPTGRKIPLWFGGHEDVTLQRIATWGDGWIMLAHPPGDEARVKFTKLRALAKEAGRDPAAIGIEVWTSTAEGDGPAAWRDAVKVWRDLGVTHVTLNTTFGRYHHKRIPGRTMADHLNALERYREAVAPALA
jgi:probable F420-dependent oxidoreductase